MNTAIIVAAGRGTRFSQQRPKQFVEILGKPLIIHTIEKFEGCSLVDQIVLVFSEEGKAEFLALRERFPTSKVAAVVVGGRTRAESVKNGLSAVSQKTQIVVVHDGARPLVSHEEIASTIKKATETGAACLVAVLTDTIKTVESGEISGTLDRDRLRRALTPQAFSVDVLRRAFELGDINEATDECYLVEKLGYPIAIVEGNLRNIKITHPEDLLFAKACLSEPRVGMAD